MDVLRLPAAAPSACPIERGLEGLVGRLGAADFHARMFGVIHQATASAHLSALAFGEGQAPRILTAFAPGSLEEVRHCAARYTREYWRSDPTLALNEDAARDDGIARGEGAVRGTVVVRSGPGDIRCTAYRKECYGDVGLIERVSAISSCGGETVRIMIYRSRRDGRFDDGAISSLARNAGLLSALLLRHERGAARTEAAPPLRRGERPMPKRESQVCEAIVRGMTSEAIGLELGISLNTVLSYRKRAYARLGISSQNELLKLLLGPGDRQAC